MSKTHCIVIGGGLSGLSAAHTVIQGGGRVTLVEKKAFMGGNSTKATSGMNGAGTRTQKQMGVPDTTDIFEEDTIRGATSVKTGDCPPPYDLGRALTANSADAVHWIQDNFGLALDTVSRLGGHSQPRTHRSKNGTTFPGMEITYKLMTTFEDICLKSPQLAVLINKAPVQRLLTDEQTGRVIGVEYEKDGVLHQLLADAVVIASGGFGAGVLFPGSLLETLRPELMGLPTTNGDHCRGDGIVFARDIGAGTIDLEHVQVHPTGLVHMDDPDNKVKFLAAEALRGEGGILLDRDGNRFCDDLGTRDYVTRCMWEHNKPPYRLVLNSEATTNIAWHCKHYVGRRVMKFYENGSELAQDMGLTNEQLQKSFDSYNQIAESKQDPWGKKFFNGAPFNVDDQFNVAVVTPIVHYTMGGLLINAAAQCLKENSTDPVPGLFAAGEVTGGVHGKNRLGGSALLECVVFGRLAGSSVLEYTKLLNQALAAGPSSGSGQSSGSGSTISISIPQPSGDPIVVTVTGSGSGNAGGSATGEVTLPGVLSAATAFTTGRMVVETGSPSTAAPPDYVPGQKVFADEVDTKKVEAVKPSGEQKEYTLEEVAKHNKDGDVWVAVNGFVVDVTSFVDDHPGGKMALMTFAGRDATEEFNMVHEEGILEKYTPELIIGTVKPSAKL